MELEHFVGTTGTDGANLPDQTSNAKLAAGGEVTGIMHGTLSAR